MVYARRYADGTVLLHDPARELFRLGSRALAPDADTDAAAAANASLLGASKWGLFFHDGGDATRGRWSPTRYDAAACAVAFAEKVDRPSGRPRLYSTARSEIDARRPTASDAASRGGGRRHGLSRGDDDSIMPTLQR